MFVRCRIAIKALFLYFNLCPSVMLESLLCLITSKSCLTNTLLCFANIEELYTLLCFANIEELYKIYRNNFPNQMRSVQYIE